MSGMTFDERIEEHERRRAAALAMGGEAKLERRRQAGVLNVRERIDHLLDEGTFRETGLFATSIDPAQRDSTPTDGKVTGYGKVEGRPVAVVGYDFTVKGSSSSTVSERKMSHTKRSASRWGMPIVYLDEATGIRMPDAMGGAGMGMLDHRDRFLRERVSPWATGVFGFAYGSAAWHAVAADFAVVRKGATLAVSSPGLVGAATGSEVDSEELGGWRVHAEVTGFADAVADSDEEAIDLIRRFLSYLPTNNAEPPPTAEVPAGSGSRAEEILEVLPETPYRVYDTRKVIDLVVDHGSFFELKERFGRSLVTGLARIEGQAVGIIGSNPMFKGGAIDVDACTKAISMIVLCDSFNLPIVFLVDQPGFLIGADAERSGILGKVINWMNALSLVTVPRLTVIMRKSFGQAFMNMGAGGMADAVAAWWTADVSFMDPRTAVRVVNGVDEQSDPERFAAALAEMDRPRSAYDLAAVFGAHDVIDPRQTREWLASMLDVHDLRHTGGVGQHRLANWPTSH